MIKVTLVGNGAVSKHLALAFSKTDKVVVVQVLSSRSNSLIKEKAANSIYASAQEKIEQTDIFIVAVSDDAIATVAEKLKATNKLVVHTSGSVAMTVLPSNIRKGVFYPLQTFSAAREVNFNTIPIGIEASKENDLILLREMANAISSAVYDISSVQRKSLHLAAVFVNNFTNHMYQIANDICEENKVSFNILKPLIKETAAKIEALSPSEAQTGPAKRGDTNTIQKHLEQLTKETHKEVYSILTQSIKNSHGEKL